MLEENEVNIHSARLEDLMLPWKIKAMRLVRMKCKILRGGIQSYQLNARAKRSVNYIEVEGNALLKV
jgi:hypothetical protein